MVSVSVISLLNYFILIDLKKPFHVSLSFLMPLIRVRNCFKMLISFLS